MSRRKRTSSVLETAHQRLAGLNSITPEPNFGATLKIADYGTQISTFRTHLDAYNQMLSTLDDLQNSLDAEEVELRESNKRYLSAIEAHYGPDSSEYEQAGGTRTSERKKPKAKGSGGSTPPTS